MRGHSLRIARFLRRCAVLLAAAGMLFAAGMSATPGFAIDIDPQVNIGPQVLRGGWDIKAWPARLDTIGEAQNLYQSVGANLLRVPIFANAHNPDGSVDTSQYVTELNAIQSVLAVNPDVEIFASLKLEGAGTFPAWVGQGSTAWPQQNGSIFGNTVLRPNPEHYSQMIADYFAYMESNGVKIDYLGLNNETEGALTWDRHIGTVDLLPTAFDAAGVSAEYRNFQQIGPDSFGLPTAENFANDLATAGRLDTIDITGSHFYPQHSSGNENDWNDLAAITGGKPAWHTEVHMPGNEDALADIAETIRDSVSVLFSSINNGVDSFVWWDSGANASKLRDRVKRELINTLVGATPIETTPTFTGKNDPAGEPLYQAFAEDGEVTLWVINPGGELTSVPVDVNGRIVDFRSNGPSNVSYNASDNDLVSGDLGSLSLTVDADDRGFVIDAIPADTIAIFTFDLVGPGDLNGDGLVNLLDWIVFKTNLLSDVSALDPLEAEALGDMNLDGLIDGLDFRLFKDIYNEANGFGALESLIAGVPEPASLAMALCALAGVTRRRR